MLSQDNTWWGVLLPCARPSDLGHLQLPWARLHLSRACGIYLLSLHSALTPRHLSLALGHVTHCPDGVVGSLPPPQTKAGFIVVRKPCGTFHAAFMPATPSQASWGGQPEPRKRPHLRVTHPWFPEPWSHPFQPLPFPRGRHRLREGKRLGHSHTAGWGPVLGPAFAQPVLKTGGSGELCPPFPRAFPMPLFHFLEQGRREGGRQAAPLSAAPARSSWEGILHPTDLRRHRRIKDRWITANEPACTINTREPSRD